MIMISLQLFDETTNKKYKLYMYETQVSNSKRQK